MRCLATWFFLGWGYGDKSLLRGEAGGFCVDGLFVILGVLLVGSGGVMGVL